MCGATNTLQCVLKIKFYFFKSLLTSFLFLSSSLLKLLSSKARKRLSTIKLPITSAGKNMKKQLSAPVSCSARIQSHRGSIHSPQSIRNIIMNEWKKSLKFHLQSSMSQGCWLITLRQKTKQIKIWNTQLHAMEF